jgi:hypothetical protein
MTMQHITRSLKVSLAIRHPHIDPAEISKALQLEPTRATRAGAPRTTPTGNPLPGTYDFSHWTHQFDVAGALELGVILEELVQRLQVHQSFFHRLVQEGGTVELFCGIFAAGNWDEILSHALMSELSGLKIDLRLDVYPKDGDAPAPIK